MTLIVILILSAGVAASIYWKKLTVSAAILGGVLGWLIYAGDGYGGLLILAAFFILGTLATSWKKERKGAGLSGERRTAGQVFANGGIAAIAGGGMLIFPSWHIPLSLAIAGSLASATADTLSSELGMVYGSRVYHVLTWKGGQRGENGMVSIEGLLIGVAGAVVIAGLYMLTAGGAWMPSFWIIVIAGFTGNLVDSVLGAVLERRGLLGNNAVNFFNTLAGGLVAGIAGSYFFLR